MQYRSYADLAHVVATQGHRLPPDIDLVVGIPRSGLLAANMISLARNLPLADLDGFIAGRVLGSGWTKPPSERAGNAGPRHVLVVDDSISSGRSMREARDKLAAAGLEARITFCAVFGRSDTDNPEADLVLERVALPRAFEWNIFHHKNLARMCFDIDGVLCHDPDRSQNDDGDRYLAFLLDAAPLYATTRPIGHLVTSRLEKYRPQTEAWLDRHGVQYGKLWMLDLPTAAERRRRGAHGAFKAGVYKQTDTLLFVESEARQARQIAALAGKPVLSIAEHRLVHGFEDARTGAPARPPRPSIARRALGRLKRMARETLQAGRPRT